MEIRIRMVSEIVDCGTSTLATGIPSVSTPWNKNVADLAMRGGRTADQNRACRNEAHLARRGVNLHKTIALGVHQNADRAQHGGKHGADDAHLIHVHAGRLRKAGIGAGGAHRNARLGTGEQPHQRTAREYDRFRPA